VLTRNALEMLKSIATGEYKTPEERAAAKAEEAVSEETGDAPSEEKSEEPEPASPESETGEAS
jgi:hypothetical protein